MTRIDLDAYFARIHYSGPRNPTYDTLAAVLRGHTANIPFESFDVLLGRSIRLDTEGLQAKIVAARRGGYCFEHASLMYAALEAIGFAPVRHSSRVLLFESRNESARQHMFLTVATGCRNGGRPRQHHESGGQCHSQWDCQTDAAAGSQSVAFSGRAALWLRLART